MAGRQMPDLGGGGAPRAQPRRKRRSREEVSQALVDAAAQLFAERPSGRVTVREIAARADVNPALAHRYFGSKQNLMRAAMAKSQHAIAAHLSQMTDVRRDLDLLYRATVGEKEFIAVIARASLDGVLPELPAGYPTMGGLVERIEAELRTAPAGRHDPRVVVACLSALTLGYALFGEFIRRGTGLAEMPETQLEEEIIEVLRRIIDLALMDQPRPGCSATAPRRILGTAAATTRLTPRRPATGPSGGSRRSERYH
jgi:AcrR family transcriptional regulator